MSERQATPPSPPGRLLPWTRSCFVCGQDNPHGLHLRSYLDADGTVRLAYTPREADLGWRHLVHGGIAMTLVDEVMTWAAIVAARRACVAVEVTVRLRKPIRVGEPLRVEGRAETVKPRLIATAGRIVNGAGVVVAEASGKYMPMPPDQVPLCSEDFVTGPGAVELRELLRGSEPLASPQT